MQSKRSRLYFNPPTPCGVGREHSSGSRANIYISIHHPLRGGTAERRARVMQRQHFNPPTPCGVGHLGWIPKGRAITDFNPPTPCGVGLSTLLPPLISIIISNPPTPCGWDPGSPRLWGGAKVISIHPPLAGWDPKRKSSILWSRISIHPPLGGVGPRPLIIIFYLYIFQSTHPLAGWDDLERT